MVQSIFTGRTAFPACIRACSGSALLLFVLLWVGPLSAQVPRSTKTGAQPLGGCNRSNGRYRRSFRNGAYILSIAANPDADEEPENACGAELRDSSGGLIFQTAGAAVSAVLVDDVNGDHEPDVVLESFSGGAHCCWRYDIVSVGATPGLVGEFESSHGAAFRTSKDRRMVITAYSGAFDYFDGLCYACSPAVQVYFVLEGKRFRDISPVFTKLYDQPIADARAQLTPDKLTVFRASDPAANADPGWELNDTKALVLTVVLNYLYSGRPQQGWEAFAEMWPVPDQERTRALIEKTVGKGVLGSIADWNARQ